MHMTIFLEGMVEIVRNPKTTTFHLCHPYSGNFGFSLKGNATNAILSGLGDYQLNNSEFNKTEISLDLNIIFPKLDFKAGKSVNVKICM